VILTVDDDPAVSRGVARDLRRQYGEKWRIVRAESGADALEACRQIRLRGEQVAVLIADYKMPEMTGIEFLEQAMDVFPYAKRVLLTAYADTEAAIAAINVVDLDHYLLKTCSRRGPGRSGRRSRRRSWLATGGRPVRLGCGSSWLAAGCRTSGSPRTARRGRGCSRRPGWTTGCFPC
jgi:CheY-like chemotaxis protein